MYFLTTQVARNPAYVSLAYGTKINMASLTILLVNITFILSSKGFV